jgi:hypothetical protein
MQRSEPFDAIPANDRFRAELPNGSKNRPLRTARWVPISEKSAYRFGETGRRGIITA